MWMMLMLMVMMMFDVVVDVDAVDDAFLDDDDDDGDVVDDDGGGCLSQPDLVQTVQTLGCGTRFGVHCADRRSCRLTLSETSTSCGSKVRSPILSPLTASLTALCSSTVGVRSNMTTCGVWGVGNVFFWGGGGVTGGAEWGVTSLPTQPSAHQGGSSPTGQSGVCGNKNRWVMGEGVNRGRG